MKVALHVCSSSVVSIIGPEGGGTKVQKDENKSRYSIITGAAAQCVFPYGRGYGFRSREISFVRVHGCVRFVACDGQLQLTFPFQGACFMSPERTRIP